MFASEDGSSMWAWAVVAVLIALGIPLWLFWRTSRRAALIEGARNAVRSLHDSVEARGSEPMSGTSIASFEKMAQSILERLRRDGLLHDGEWSIEANDADTLAAALDVLERRLEGERRAVAGGFIGFIEKRRRLVQPSASPTQSELLMNVTERFYGSPAVKLLGVALVVAVLLAGSGSLLIGGQVVGVTRNLEKSAEEARQKVSEEAALQQAVLKARTDEVAREVANRARQVEEAQTTFNDRRDKFSNFIADAQNKVQQQVATFTMQSGDLQKEVVAKILESVQAQLNSRVGELSEGLGKRAADALGTLDMRLRALDIDARIEALRARVDDSTAAVDAMKRDVEAVEPTLRRAKTVAAEIDGPAGSLDRIRTMLGELADAATKAQASGSAAATAARQAGEQAARAEDAWGTLQGTVADLKKNADALQRDAVGVRARLDTIAGDVDRALESARQASGKAAAAADSTTGFRATAATTAGELTEAGAAAVSSAGEIDRLRTGAANRAAELEKLLVVAAGASPDAFRRRLDAQDARLSRLEQPARPERDPRTDGYEMRLRELEAGRVPAGYAAIGAHESRIANLEASLAGKQDADGGDARPSDGPLVSELAGHEKRICLLEEASRLPARTEQELAADERRRIQEALVRFGLDVHGNDGKFGGKTRAAIRRFQTSLREPDTGQLTMSQIRILFGGGRC